MTREHEYEVLKRHDVYVVRKVGTQEYAASTVSVVGCRFYRFWHDGHPSEAHHFRFKWAAILKAKKLEKEARKKSLRMARSFAYRDAT